jgi:hypothetical protein
MTKPRSDVRAGVAWRASLGNNVPARASAWEQADLPIRRHWTQDANRTKLKPYLSIVLSINQDLHETKTWLKFCAWR